ncbi:hypothetical protein FH972_007749 [Carpinus fangiana]|uniref:Uncharacterized protein n=1 Tax=Carpinus fangiana TaxID=176857 RepID=A0A5N6QWK0_9ROSI|nr:hypothetical protein FH972_007749 [Carpinus fangiana]
MGVSSYASAHCHLSAALTDVVEASYDGSGLREVKVFIAGLRLRNPNFDLGLRIERCCRATCTADALLAKAFGRLRAMLGLPIPGLVLSWARLG